MPGAGAARSVGRRIGAGVVVVAVATLGALILGEYEFSGVMPYAAGVLFGLVLGEIAVAVAGGRSGAVGVVTGAAGAAGLVWAAWISSGEGLRPFPAVAWVAAAIAFAAGGSRVGGWGSSLRSRRS